MTDRILVSVTVNGVVQERWVEPRLHLGDFLREELGLKGTHLGCEHGVCGACTVLLDGALVRSCLTLAVQADGAMVDTIEGRSESGEIRDLQDAFHERNALQCGFCTPGLLLTADALLRDEPDAGRARIREGISGNYCRCTGYHAIVDAIEAVGRTRRPGCQGHGHE
ncbi:(2Fe-2S)-binding protein [Azospirillum sp. ST 5-10]|uniref:(2Fe-2S)-binding protein n=1 Tax=unclassified Azospirillum TaxID=2630922 RepID=UPI003F4A3797